MKKIIPYILVLGLAVVVLVQYFKLQSLNPPESYEYIFREDIDLDYHDPTALGAYYRAGHDAGSYAREQWRSKGINVRLPLSDDSEQAAASRHYNRLRAYADSLGARLSRSWEWKSKGFNNGEIIRLEREGVSPSELLVERTFGSSRLKKGDRTEGVWALQGLLIQKGYEIPHDGYFWEETTIAVRDYQQKNKLPVSGMADQKTLATLIHN